MGGLWLEYSLLRRRLNSQNASLREKVKTMGTPVLLTCLLLAASTTRGAAPVSPPTSPAAPSPDIRPICGAFGYTLQTGYRFGAKADLLPGETPVRSTADMVKLGWKHDEPWGRINNQLQYYVDFSKPEYYLGPSDPARDVHRQQFDHADQVDRVFKPAGPGSSTR